MKSYYSVQELELLGLKEYGKDVLISRKASIYGADSICLGNSVRIDDFCILSGQIRIGNHVHIAAYSALYGGEKGIWINDFANLSSRVSVYSVSDDYTGESMTNPTIPIKYKKLLQEKVYIGKHVIIGSTSVVLPGVQIADGGAFGAFSFINRNTEEWTMYAGIPVREIRKRKKNLLEFEKRLRNEEK